MLSPTQFVSNQAGRGIQWQDSSRKSLLLCCLLRTRRSPRPEQAYPRQLQAWRLRNHPKPRYSSAFLRVFRWSGGKLFLI